jgi:thiol-disulfide isomerase/thioredoxin
MRSLTNRAILFVVGAACCQAGTEHPRSRLELVDAPPAIDVAAEVAARVDAATRDRKHLVVYVGATWCEPCRYFHDAAVAGELDDELGDLRLVAFDMDRDGAALRAAGYTSAMIPLFAIPRSDGRASGEQIAGSIKGAGAARQIAPRLRALVDGHGTKQ